MHRRAREHVGLVVKRKLKKRTRRIISGITGGWCAYLRSMENRMLILCRGEWRSEDVISSERVFRPDHTRKVYHGSI